MFTLTPSYVYSSPYLPLRPQPVYRQQPPSISPRDRYVLALAEVRSAEAEYMATHVREKAIQKSRQEEARRRVALSPRQREEATFRQLLPEDGLSLECSAPYRLNDSYSDYPSAYRRYPEAEADFALFDLLERRHQREELARRERLVILHQKEDDGHQAQVIAAARLAQQIKLRKQHAILGRREEDELLSFFLGRHAPFRKESLRDKLVESQAGAITCPCAQCRLTTSNEEDDIEHLLRRVCGSKSDTAPHCPYAHRAKTEQLEGSDAQCQIRQTTVCPQQSQSATSAPEPYLKDQLGSYLPHESAPEKRDTVQNLILSLFAPAGKLEHKESVGEKKNNLKDAAAAASPSSSGLSLKEQLEARLHEDPNVEIRDTIQAILTSIMTTNATEGNSASTSVKDVKPKTGGSVPTASSSPASESKGKEKAVSFGVSTPTRKTSKEVVDSMKMIHDIQAEYNTLLTDFSFPTRLDFMAPSSVPLSPPASDSNSRLTSQLAYTSTNAPVRYYEQSLGALLSQLDAVESWGSEKVRKERKEIVGRIEMALEEVEKEVQDRFMQFQARNARSEPFDVQIEKTQSNEAHVIEVVNSTPTGLITTATAVSEAVEAPTAVENAFAPADQHSEDVEEISVIEEGTLSSTYSGEIFQDHSEQILRPNNVPVFTSVSLINEACVSPMEESENAEDSSLASAVTITSTDRDANKEAANATVVLEHNSPRPSAGETSAFVSPNGHTTREESELVDTFLLTATTEAHGLPKRPAFNEVDELVVIDKEHGEASDGENWSEVEA